MHGVNRLRQARLARGLTLEEISAETRLPPRIVEKIDDGEFGALPAGIYARAYVRGFAGVVGLEPETVIAELAPMLPGAPDPLPVMRENAREQIPQLGPGASRCVAAIADGLVLTAIATLLVLLTRAALDTAIVAWTFEAAAGLAIATALIALPYFLFVRGLARAVAEGRSPEVTMRVVTATTAVVFLEEISIVFDLMWRSSFVRPSPPAQGQAPVHGAKLPHELPVS